MLHKCACGTFTEYGPVCVNCALSKKSSVEVEEESIEIISIEELLEEEDQEDEQR